MYYRVIDIFQHFMSNLCRLYFVPPLYKICFVQQQNLYFHNDVPLSVPNHDGLTFLYTVLL